MIITPNAPIKPVESGGRTFVVNSLTPIVTDNHGSRQVSVKFVGLPMAKPLVLWTSSNYFSKDLSDNGIKTAVLSALGSNPGETISALCF